MEVTEKRLIEIMNRFNDKSVAVIGDLCLDEYIYGTANSLSPEAPIPRVVVDSRKYVPGTAGNVACGTQALGAKTSVYGVIGSDSNGKILLEQLSGRGIDVSGINISQRNTPTYSRVVASGQQLVRFDVENEQEIDDGLVSKIYQDIKLAIPDSNAIIFADYDEIGHGLVRQNHLDNLAQLASKHKKILVGISRTRINEFKDFTLVVPNEKEALHAVGLKLDSSGIRDIGRILTTRLGSNVAITQGKEGVSVFSASGDYSFIPAFAKSVVDVTGAGDTFTSMMTLALASGATLKEAAYLGSYAAAAAVRKSGTASVTREEIYEIRDELWKIR